MSTAPNRQARIAGAVYGLAYGDAWGYPQEFKTWREIATNPLVDLPTPALISDDTQMSLYVIAAVLADLNEQDSEIRALGNNEAGAIDEIRVKIGEYLIHWMDDPDNDRAPGNTCMSSLRRLSRAISLTGLEGTNDNSKGNGANIRCPWIGLLPREDASDSVVAALGAIQSSTTHNEPYALGSAALTSLIVRGLIEGDVTPGGILNYAIEQTETLLTAPISHMLPGEYRVGLDQTRSFLARCREAHREFLATEDELQDVCAYFGEGWVAEEALACAIALTDRYAGTEPLNALYRAANSGGDSDSIGAITGAFVGVAAGIEAFPADWADLLEPRYAHDLAETATRLGA